MIGIIDYGMGNLYSVSKALERLGAAFFVSDRTDALQKADGLILPGVGAFQDAMTQLEAHRFVPFIQTAVEQKTPLLGICLGMQLLFSESEENGRTEGLGILPGDVRRFSGVNAAGERYNVPHMGWNWVHVHQPAHPLFQDLAEGYAYFVHAYAVRAHAGEQVLASSDYHGDVPGVVGSGYVFGTQFHPEKSSTFGMTLLGNYCRLVEREGK